MKTTTVLRMTNPSALEELVSEPDAIRILGLQHAPNPKGAIRWLVRTKRLAPVRINKCTFSYHREDLYRFINRTEEGDSAGPEGARHATQPNAGCGLD